MQSKRYDTELSFSEPAAIAARAFRRGIPSDAVANVEVCPSLSTGKTITLTHQYSGRYPAGGSDALVDGFKGSRDYNDGFWQGYEGTDVEAVVDLGQIRQISRVESRYLQDTRAWIFFPSSVEFAVSNDGVTFVPIVATEHAVAEKDQDLSIEVCSHQLKDVQARFVKVHARSVGVCPPWHPGAGGKAWLFTDEFEVW